MADSHKRPYILEALGLIVLFAIAMAAIAYPVKWIEQPNTSPLPLQVQANETK